MGSVTACAMDVITEKSGHSMTGLAVSVCLTPAAPSPLPIPYPTMATVSEGVIDECLRTKIDGAKVLTVGSCTKNCHGNEPGTLKEVVSLNTAGPCFPIMGAPIVFIELGMAGITLSPGFMNKNPIPGIGGSASGAGGGGGGGGGAGGGAGGPPGSSTNGPSNGGGGGGGSNSGAAPPNAPGAPGADGQAKAGHPVDIITGTMYTTPAVDAELFGPLPLQWVRQYRSSSVDRTFGIGWGWSHSFVWSAEASPDGIRVTDAEGTVIPFPHVAEGETAHAPFGRRLERRGEDLVVVTRDGVERVLRPSGRGRYRLCDVRDRSGNLTEIVWDGGEIAAVIDCVGRRLEREQSLRTTVWKLVLIAADGSEHRRFAFSYELDAAGDLVRVTDAGGVTTSYAYDEQHYLIEERLPDGLVYHFRYETQGDGVRRCVETWGDLPGRDIVSELAGGRRSGAKGILHMRLDYGPGPYETTVTDAEGAVHRYRGNALGMVESYVDPLGFETQLRYDRNGHLVLTSHQSGASDRLTCDAMGRPLHASDANGRSVTLRRNTAGDLVELSDPAGALWKMEYDGAGRMVKRRDPSGAATTCDYGPSGLPVKITGPGGTEELAYDAHGNLIERSDARGAKWTYAWDLLGLPVEMRTPTGEEYHLSYDSRGGIVEVNGPLGRRMERQFDARGRVSAVRHPGGGITRSRHLGEVVVERVFPHGASLRWGYDAMLRPLWIENTAGERHLFEYDKVGQIVRQRTFAGLEYRYEYDSLGRCTKRINPSGRAAHLTLDPLGQVVRREQEGAPVHTFERDVRGFVTRATNGAATVELTRDITGRVVRETQTCGGWQFVVDHEYSSLGYEVGTRYSTGWYVSRRRGALGALQALTVHGKDGAVLESVDFEEGAEHVVRRSGRKDGVAVTYDVLGRPSRVRVLGEDGRLLRERSYTWAAQPGVTKIEDSARGTRTYELDPIGRPLRVNGIGVQDEYEYAPQGTPIARSEGPAHVGAAGRKHASGDARFHWDSRARLGARTHDDPRRSWSFTYDEEDRLTEARRGDGLSIRYLYDPFGRRLAAVRSDGSSTFFGWDGDAIVEERDSTGTVERRVFRDDRRTLLLDSLDGQSYRLVATDLASTPFLYLARDGAVSAIDLGPTGKDVMVEGRPGGLRFAGQRADVETGLRYQRHRYYSTELGTFLTPDPLGLMGSVHDIGFVPNPTEYMDPLGLIIIIGYEANDDHPDEHGRGETQRAAMARGDATGQEVVHASQLRSPGNPNGRSLEGETHIEVVTHGSTTGGQVIFNSTREDGSRRNWVNGRQLGGALRDAGMQQGAEVVLVACNAAMTPTARPRQSVIAGVNQETGNPCSGPSGICYVRPYNTQYCGVCPPTAGNNGSVDMTDGHWEQATGPRGGTPSVTPVPSPSTQHADTWTDPNASSGRGPHGGGFPGAPPHQD